MQKMQMCHNTLSFMYLLVLETVEIVSFYQTIIHGTSISFSRDVQQKSFS